MADITAPLLGSHIREEMQYNARLAKGTRFFAVSLGIDFEGCTHHILLEIRNLQSF